MKNLTSFRNTLFFFFSFSLSLSLSLSARPPATKRTKAMPPLSTSERNLSSLSGAHVLITGGASGIGAALADACAAGGAGAVSILDADARGAAAAAALLREGNPGLFAAAFACDVTSPEQVETISLDSGEREGRGEGREWGGEREGKDDCSWGPRARPPFFFSFRSPPPPPKKKNSGEEKKVRAAVRAATEAHGPISLLFANAGIGPCGLFLEGCESAASASVAAEAAAAGSSKKKAAPPLTRSASAAAGAAAAAAAAPPSCPWQRTMAVNYGGVVSVLQATLPRMVSQGRGRVVVTGSMGERTGERRQERGRVVVLLLATTTERKTKKLARRPRGKNKTSSKKKNFHPSKKNSGGFMGAAGLSAYSASKHALRGLCDCLRLEVGEKCCSSRDFRSEFYALISLSTLGSHFRVENKKNP